MGNWVSGKSNDFYKSKSANRSSSKNKKNAKPNDRKSEKSLVSGSFHSLIPNQPNNQNFDSFTAYHENLETSQQSIEVEKTKIDISKKQKTVEVKAVVLLLQECKNDNRSIRYTKCIDLLHKCSSYDLLNESDPYTGESILHLSCSHGHYDLIEDLLMKEPRMVNLTDLQSDTPFHSLCRNTSSSDEELITVFQYLNQHQIKVHKRNKDGFTGIEIITQRIRNRNPYDGNLSSVRLLYWNILDSIPVKYLEHIK